MKPRPRPVSTYRDRATGTVRTTTKQFDPARGWVYTTKTTTTQK